MDEDAYDRLARYNLGLVLLQQNKPLAAIQAFNELRNWSDKPVLFDYYYGLALQAFEDRLSDSIDVFSKMVQTKSQFPHGHIGMAYSLSRVDNISQANDTLYQACMTPLHYLAEHQWRTYLVGDGWLEVSKALQMQEKDIKAKGISVERLTGYAYLFLMQGRNKDAAKVVQKALQQDGDDRAATPFVWSGFTSCAAIQTSCSSLSTCLTNRTQKCLNFDGAIGGLFRAA